jgi:predicted dehydrogenase
MVRIGLIGLGFMGRVHFDAYSQLPIADVIAAADRDPNRARGDLSEVWGNLGDTVSKHLPMDKIKGTVLWPELMASPDIDVIDICVPTPDHVTIVLAALQSGKHVLCEKPLARTSADALRIAEAAAKAKGFFMPAMCMRFWSEWEWLANAVRDGRYGKVLSASFSRLGSCPVGWYRNGALSGGALLDLHVHDTDFVYHLFGKPRAVFSRGFTVMSGEPDHIVTQYLYDNGPNVTTTGSWANSPGTPFKMEFVVNFEKATVNYDMSRTQTLMAYHDDKAEPIETAKLTGYVGELGYFLDCVANRRKPTRVTVDDAVMGLRILEAEKLSAESGRVVELS